MRRSRVRTGLAALAAVLLSQSLAFAAPRGLAAVSEPAAAAPAEPAAGPPAAEIGRAPEAPIALAELSARAEALRAKLRALQQDAAKEEDLARAERDLAEAGNRIRADAEAARALLEQGPRLLVLEDIETSWQEERKALIDRSDELTRRTRSAQTDLEFLAHSKDLWKRTLESAKSQDAPQATLDRAKELIGDIDATERLISSLRARILALLDVAAGQLGQVDDSLAAIDTHRREVVDRLWVADAPPLWTIGSEREDLANAWRRIGDDARRRGDHARSFLHGRSRVFALQVSIGIALAAFFVWGRRRTARWREEDPATADAFRVFECPYSSAIVLALIASVLLHPELPRVLVQTGALAALWPVVRVLRPLVPPALHWELHALAGFFVLDRVRDILSAAPRIEQAILAAEMAIGAVLLAVVVRNALRAERAAEAIDPGPGLPRFRWLETLLLGGFLAAFLAAVLGMMQLARLVAGAMLSSLYVAMALYAGARSLRGLLAVALRVRPLSKLRLVDHHRPLVESRVGRWIGWAGVAFWGYATLRNLGFLGPFLAATDSVLAASWTFGSFTITLGDLVAVALTLWISIALSRLVRFVLEEDVFPRVELGRGIPYALSNLVGYTIVLIGFLLALATVGLDANRATILAGAFGVGIGFGLQNIVNNFVSGLILLFERPVQVGDVVQIGEVLGEVRRIGIRSSTVRTFDGAEVIVPNADLIAERVTNWTLSDSTRRIEISVGVAYGTDLDRVVRLLEGTARKHRDVIGFPAPMAIFLRFGESSMDFELRAWVADGTRWSQTRTELAIDVWKALSDAGITIPFPQREVRTVAD